MNAMNSGADTDKDLELFVAKVSPETPVAEGRKQVGTPKTVNGNILLKKFYLFGH